MLSFLARPRVAVRCGYTAVRHMAGIIPPKKVNSSTEKLERLMQMTESNTLGFDPWAQPAPIYGGKDLHVPTPWSTLLKQASLRERLKFVRLGLENKVSNAVAMFQIARAHSLPWNPTASPYSLQIFRSSSTRSNTWLEPLRDIARDSYEQINKAVAVNDVGVVRALSEGNYQKRLLARMKTMHPPSTKKAKKAPTNLRYSWRLHSLASPIKCVSIRTAMGHLGKRPPRIGTRYILQACLRFDTWQSLTLVSSSTSSPAEQKRVLEYLVFEKKMWYDGPWVVRDQLWEGVLNEHRRASDEM